MQVEHEQIFKLELDEMPLQFFQTFTKNSNILKPQHTTCTQKIDAFEIKSAQCRAFFWGEAYMRKKSCPSCYKNNWMSTVKMARLQ